MYDSHAHINSAIIQPNLDSVLNSFAQLGGRGLLNVAYDLESCFKVIDSAKNFFTSSDMRIFTSVGLHPELFYTRGDMENPITSLEGATRSIKKLQGLIDRNRENIHCIGETGLDYLCIKEDNDLTVDEKEYQIELQKHSFSQHVKIAKEQKLPLTIHLRDIADSNDVVKDALSIIAINGNGLVNGSFHSYTLSASFLDEILALGFMIGVNGIITYNSGENIREIVRFAGLENILLETDTPYLPPQNIRSQKIRKNSEPSDILEIAKKVSETLSIDLERVLRITSENFMKTFASDE